MTRVVHHLAGAIASYPAESRVLGLGRTVIATAQATVLLFTPASHLFVPVGPEGVTVDCTRLPQSASAYCVTGDLDRQVTTWGLLILLVVIASGLLPRIMSIIHVWVSLSVGMSISLPDGGESIAQVCTIFLMLASLNDRRTWHWQAPRRDATDSVFQGVAWAGHWGLRLQLAYVYLNSAVAKVSVDPWQEGTATYYVARMENFGAAGLFSDVIIWATGLTSVALLTAWGAIVTEALIAMLILQRGARQVCALALCTGLHLMIIVQLGIVSFGLIMIGAVLCATSRGTAEVLRPAAERHRGRRAAPSTPHEAPMPQKA